METFVEGDVAHQFGGAVGLVDAVYADIDDDGAFFEPMGFYEFRLADGGDDDVAKGHQFFNIFAFGMDDGDGAIFLQQQLSYGLSDDVGAADDDGVQAGEGFWFPPPLWGRVRVGGIFQ